MRTEQSVRQRLAAHLGWWKYLYLDRRRGRGYPESVEQWNRDYVSGAWDKLSAMEEVGRFGVIAAYIQRLRPQARILDLGCGPGLLLDYLSPACFRSYLGVDLSEVAIARAKATWPADQCSFHQGSIEEFAQEEQYDVIVFNEVLYYLAEPLKQVSRLAGRLSEGGLTIVSMVQPSGDYIWDVLTENLHVLGRQKVINSSGTSWQIGVICAR